MEDDQLKRPRYYRRILVDNRFWDFIFNLPKGFKVEAVMQFPEWAGYQFLVRCPGEEQYEVGLEHEIPMSTAHSKELGDGTRILYHPDLGQEEPPDRPNLKDIAFESCMMLETVLDLLSEALDKYPVVHQQIKDITQKLQDVMDA